jgi:hypothetical protein
MVMEREVRAALQAEFDKKGRVRADAQAQEQAKHDHLLKLGVVGGNSSSKAWHSAATDMDTDTNTATSTSETQGKGCGGVGGQQDNQNVGTDEDEEAEGGVERRKDQTESDKQQGEQAAAIADAHRVEMEMEMEAKMEAKSLECEHLTNEMNAFRGRVKTEVELLQATINKLKAQVATLSSQLLTDHCKLAR